MDAFAIFGAGGELLGASEPFHALVQSPALPPRCPPARLLRELGFSPTPGSPDCFQKGAVIVRQRLEPTRTGATLLVLTEALAPHGAAWPHTKFLSVASHDLRGSVSNIRAYAGLLLGGRVPLDPKAQRWLEVIARNADKTLDTLRDLFDGEYADAGILQMDKLPQPVEPLLQSALIEAQEAAQAKGVEIVAQLPTGLPELQVDGAAITHAVSAFLEHGLARSEQGARLEVSAGAVDGQLLVQVTDKGPELSAVDAEHAFDRKRRAAQEGKLAAGFKLGVAAAEITLHGGRVGVERASGQTTFFFSIPL